jgi:DNA polymerase III subunit delta
MSYKQIIKDIKSKKFEKIYLLHGDEPYFIDCISNALMEHVLEEHERDFNQAVLYGKETTIAQIIAEAKQFPMMSERRLVMVKEAQNLGKNLADLLSYAEQANDSTVLVICHKHSTIDGRSKLATYCAKNHLVFKSEKPKDYLLVDSITELARDLGYMMSPKASFLLAEFIGNDLSRIANELEKLSLLVEKGQTINEVHIEENIGISKEYNIFELNKAIGLRDVPKAMQIINYFEKNPKSASLPGIIINLFGLFRNLLKLHFWTGSDQEYMQANNIKHPFFLKEYRSYQKIYPKQILSRNIALLHEYDLKSKGINNKDFEEMQLAQELIFKLMH